MDGDRAEVPCVGTGSGQASSSNCNDATDEAGSNQSFTGRIFSEVKIMIGLRVPGYTQYLNDGSRTEIEAKDYVVDVIDIHEYSMHNLLADLANKTKWGTCQDPTFWYWDIEKRGLQSVATDVDLKLVLQKFESLKAVSFVVEFVIKPIYKTSTTIEAKLEKLPVRRNPILAEETKSSTDSDEKSGEESIWFPL